MLLSTQPPRQIPFHYADKVRAQLDDMVKEGIIHPSTSTWWAPAVYAPERLEFVLTLSSSIK